MIRKPARTIDQYIAGFPPDVQGFLQQIRMTIRTAAPQAEETISYRIPAFTLKGRYLVYFAAFKQHVGLYPAPTGDAKFKKQVDQPLPLDLIRTIVKLRMKEDQERAAARVTKKKEASR